jgi:hypothetical protein
MTGKKMAGRGRPGHLEKGENGIGYSGVTCMYFIALLMPISA